MLSPFPTALTAIPAILLYTHPIRYRYLELIGMRTNTIGYQNRLNTNQPVNTPSPLAHFLARRKPSTKVSPACSRYAAMPSMRDVRRHLFASDGGLEGAP